MKASQLAWITSVLVLAATAVGCQNNGDPGKDYSKVKNQANVKVDPSSNVKPVSSTPTPVAPPAPAPQWDCNHPFDVSVEKDAGKGLLVFTENTESTYTIKIHSNLGSDFKVEPTDLSPELSADFHAGRAKFTTVKVEGMNASYKFVWKPSKNRGDQPNFAALKLLYSSTGTAICDTKNPEMLNLLVQPQGQKTGDAK